MKKTIGRRNSSLLIFALFAGAFLVGAVTPMARAQTPLEQIDEFIVSQMGKNKIPGLAIGIVEGDEILYTQGYGKADSDDTEMTAHTPVLLGSLSTPLTATAILQLVNASFLELDATVHSYLPWFQLSEITLSDQITVQDCLYHMSGIPSDAGTDEPNLEDTLNSTVADLQNVALTFEPGAGFLFSDMNYQILGLLIETVNPTNQTFAEYMHDHVFTPLNMTDSYALPSEAQENGLAEGHRVWYGLPVSSESEYYDIHGPSSAISASTEDLAHYLIAQMNQGTYDGRSILPSELTALQQARVPKFANISSYAMGWGNYTWNGYEALGISGDLLNYHADLMMIPGLNYGVVVVMNVNHFIGTFSYYNEIILNVFQILQDNETETRWFTLYWVYVIINIVIVMSLIREGNTFVKIKHKSKLFYEKFNSMEEKRNQGIGKFVADFVFAIFLLGAIPFIIGIGIGVSGFSIFVMMRALPDLAIYLYLMAFTSTARGFYRMYYYGTLVSL
ncbi:MAG: serine hydrolase domain-containing protein [Promethearchaeota archaeon]